MAIKGSSKTGIWLTFNSDKFGGRLTKKQRSLNEEVMDSLEEEAKTVLKESLQTLGLDNPDHGGPAGESIKKNCSVKRSGTKVTISCSSPHAVYVEYGTGMIGERGFAVKYDPKGDDYKSVEQYFDADIDSIRPASYVPGTGPNIVYLEWMDAYGWFFRGDDGELHISTGMPARPFMWLTREFLKDFVEGELDKVISDHAISRLNYGWRNWFNPFDR